MDDTNKEIGSRLKAYRESMAQSEQYYKGVLDILYRIWWRVLLKGTGAKFSAWGPSVKARSIQDARDICEAILDEFPEVQRFEKHMSGSGEQPEWYWQAKIRGLYLSVSPAAPDENCTPKRVYNQGYSYSAWVCEKGR